jgi:hypothetical protein
MKKMFLTLLTLLTVFLPAFVFAQTGESLQGVIRELNGTVEVKQSAASPWVPALVGMRLDKNAAISTGLRSSVLIGLGDSVVTVRPLSRVQLEDLALSRETAEVALFLRAGRVQARVSPPAGGGKVNFQVRSPSVTASVRGTEFVMDPAKVKMISGTVAFAGADGVPVLVNAGQSSSAGPGGPVVSSELSPALPSGSQSMQSAGTLPSAEGKITGRPVWYGEDARREE